jgi:8-oxo-dGTP pyrophosphatase MutT (NUDIX family)
MDIPSKCNYEKMHDMYKLNNNRMVLFPHIKCVRAGFILIYKSQLLLIKEKGLFNDRGKSIQLSQFIGMPKGSVNSTDKSALMTAERELFEETGINLHDKSLCTRILNTAFIYQRCKISEIIIYFVAFIKKLPVVNICSKEIIDCKFVNMSFGMQRFSNVAKPTKYIFNLIDKYGLYKHNTCQNTISI